MKLVPQVENILRLLGDNRLQKLGLLRIENDRLTTPVTDDVLTLFVHTSKRGTEFIQQQVLEQLITAIKTSGAYKGVNHIGFCYKVSSKEGEIKRLAKLARSKGLHVYQEQSIDDADWLFVGDISEITNPVLEFLPLDGQVHDKWVDHWLPHIQFDIDTGLSPQEIKVLVKEFIHRPFTPYPISIDGITYIQRVNLGCLEGVNLMLDISTNNRDINYRRDWDRLT